MACGGDILVRGNVEDAAKFDYNSGKFAYKPIAQKAENVLSQINEVYFYAIKAEPEVVLVVLTLSVLHLCILTHRLHLCILTRPINIMYSP